MANWVYSRAIIKGRDISEIKKCLDECVAASSCEYIREQDVLDRFSVEIDERIAAGRIEYYYCDDDGIVVIHYDRWNSMAFMWDAIIRENNLDLEFECKLF